MSQDKVIKPNDGVTTFPLKINFSQRVSQMNPNYTSISPSSSSLPNTNLEENANTVRKSLINYNKPIRTNNDEVIEPLNKTSPYHTQPLPYKMNHNELFSNKDQFRLAQDFTRKVSIEALNQHYSKPNSLKYKGSAPNLMISDNKENGFRNENFKLISPNQWRLSHVTAWLIDKELAQFKDTFKEHDINGEVLLELNNGLLKQMNINKVGDRVKIMNNIKQLKRTTLKSFRNEAMKKEHGNMRIPPLHKPVTNPIKPNPIINSRNQQSDSDSESELKSKPLSKTLPFLQPLPSSPLNPYTSQLSGFVPGGKLQSPPLPSHPSENDVTIMSLDTVQRHCVRVVGDGGQTRVVDLKNALGDATSIMNRVLAKFSLPGPPESYAIFINSGETTKMLKDEELMSICNSTSHPDKDKFILRKKYSHKTHHELQQERMRRLQEQTDHAKPYASGWDNVPQHQPILAGIEVGQLDRINGLSNRHSKLFTKRPPSQQIASNLAQYFPTQKLPQIQIPIPDSNGASPPTDHKPSKRNNIRNLGIDRLPNLVGLSPIHETKPDLMEPIPSPKSPARMASPKLSSDPNDIKIPQDSPIKTEPGLSPSSVTSSPVKSEVEEGTTNKVRVSMDMEGWIQGALIGAGSFGDVYLGLNPLDQHVMAVKQVELPTATSRSESRQKVDQIASLQREIALMRELCHTNIVQYLGSSYTDTHLNIFLEYVPGGSVAARLLERGKFTEEVARYYVAQIVSGLEYLHQNNIIHRDIKGGNILVDDLNQVKIADFGVSKKVQDSVMSVITPHRVSLQGSVYWMAPEVVKQTHYTRKADIWSLGCLVIEMLSGDHPYPNFTQMQAMFKIGSFNAPEIPNNISDLAKEFLTNTLNPKHHLRPTSKELLDHPFVKDVSIYPPNPTSPQNLSITPI